MRSVHWTLPVEVLALANGIDQQEEFEPAQRRLVSDGMAVCLPSPGLELRPAGMSDSGKPRSLADGSRFANIDRIVCRRALLDGFLIDLRVTVRIDCLSQPRSKGLRRFRVRVGLIQSSCPTRLLKPPDCL